MAWIDERTGAAVGVDMTPRNPGTCGADGGSPRYRPWPSGGSASDGEANGFLNPPHVRERPRHWRSPAMPAMPHRGADAAAAPRQPGAFRHSTGHGVLRVRVLRVAVPVLTRYRSVETDLPVARFSVTDRGQGGLSPLRWRARKSGPVGGTSPAHPPVLDRS